VSRLVGVVETLKMVMGFEAHRSFDAYVTVNAQAFAGFRRVLAGAQGVA
jgi:hypothetical protein